MASVKHTSGLILFNGTRLQLSNSNDKLPAIAVNGKQLSYKDLDLGSVRITENKAYAYDSLDGNYYEIIHANSDIEIKFDSETGSKVQTGQIVPAGDSLFKQQSPAPFCYIDTSGRLASANLWKDLWIANVMGYVDVDKDTHTYKHGLCPQGSAIHESLFLRKDGQWSRPSAFTGSVSETFLSLNDTPTTYTSNLDKYLRVSYAEGGSIVFDEIDTSKVPESTTHLYYTNERVNNQMDSQLQSKSISNISISGTLTCNELLTDSDKRLKRNIHPLHPEYCLELIDEMKPCQYQFKKSNQLRFGLIAQELETTMPSLVNNVHATKSINYIDVIPLLIASVQSLKEQMHCLQNDLCVAHATIDQLRNDIAK